LSFSGVFSGVKRAVVVYGAHSLRHYFATQALADGIPREIDKRITGHASDAMLEGYGGHDRRACRKVEQWQTIDRRAPTPNRPGAGPNRPQQDEHEELENRSG